MNIAGLGMTDQQLSCDELWDAVCHRRGQPASSIGNAILSGTEFTFPSSNLRDWTGHLSKGEWIGEQGIGGTGMVYKAYWKNIRVPDGRDVPLVVAKIPRAEVVGGDHDRASKVCLLAYPASSTLLGSSMNLRWTDKNLSISCSRESYMYGSRYNNDSSILISSRSLA